jgi:hypothetical protein
MRQIADSFAQYEKTRLVTKLCGARERVREAKGKWEGRRSYAECEPELVLAGKRNGATYSASCVKSMVEGRAPAPSEGSVPA